MSEPRDEPQDVGAHPLRGRAIAHFRFDTRRSFVRALLVAIPLMVLGGASAVVGLRGLYAREPARVYASRPTFQAAPGARPDEGFRPAERALFIGGLGLVVLSHVALIAALRRHLVSDRFLLLRADGVVRQVDDTWTLVRWDDVESVRYEPASERIVFTMRDGSEHALGDAYAGIRNDALAKLLGDVHRKAIWGLLR